MKTILFLQQSQIQIAIMFALAKKTLELHILIKKKD